METETVTKDAEDEYKYENQKMFTETQQDDREKTEKVSGQLFIV